MRQVMVAAVLAVTLVLSGANLAAASQVPITEIDEVPVYILTETIEIRSRSPYEFSCTVLFDGDEAQYNFFSKNGEPYYSHKGSGEYRLSNYPYSLAFFAYNYVVENY